MQPTEAETITQRPAPGARSHGGPRLRDELLAPLAPETVVARMREFIGAARAALTDSVPWPARWLHLLGSMRQLLGDPVAAIACYQRGLSRAPTARKLRASLGYALYVEGRYLEATRVLLELLRIEDLPRARAVLALSLCEMGMVDEAEPWSGSGAFAKR